MVDVLVILDGASEPLTAQPTSLERARTPTLDALGRGGSLSRIRTVPRGLPPGSETAIPTLLGWTPPAPVDRAALEAAARGIEIAPGERAWRVDVLVENPVRSPDEATRADSVATRAVAAELAAAAPGHVVHPLSGHRLLLVGPAPLPAAVHELGLRIWPQGVLPPQILDDTTVVVGAPGAATGAARLLGAAIVTPAGATGDVDTDLAAKARAATAAIEARASRVVVHVGAPDEAAHERDAGAKVAAIERADAELIAPLAAAVRSAGGTLTVCADHGCDPATGRHDGAPVPALTWPAVAYDDRSRFTERDAAALPVAEPRVLTPA